MSEPTAAVGRAPDVAGVLIATLAERRWTLLLWPAAVGALALALTYLMPPVYTARTVFLPPQQSNSAAANALASLGALSSLAGSPIAIKSPADQYVSFLRSRSIADRIVEEFALQKIYGARDRHDALRRLADNVSVELGRKDGLITVDVDDADAARAAAVANAHVRELRRLTGGLLLSEAQQRRAFFEKQLEAAKGSLVAAQRALQGSGFDTAALRAEPRAAADSYARLSAEVAAAEIRLRTLRLQFTESSPEVQSQVAQLAALQAQLRSLEGATPTRRSVASSEDYIGKYREYKVQEALFEMFWRQYEAARLDESRDSSIIQVIDVAVAPERRSRPRRLAIALTATATAFVLLVGALTARRWLAARRASLRPGDASAGVGPAPAGR